MECPCRGDEIEYYGTSRRGVKVDIKFPNDVFLPFLDLNLYLYLNLNLNPTFSSSCPPLRIIVTAYSTYLTHLTAFDINIDITLQLELEQTDHLVSPQIFNFCLNLPSLNLPRIQTFRC